MTPYSISFQRTGASAPFIITSGQHFRFGIGQFERFFLAPLADRMIDLLRIASGIYAVDRLVRRHQRNQRRYWSRSLEINVGVLDAAFWSQNEVRDSLTETLEFLSDDTWNLRFTQDPQAAPRDFQRGLFHVGTENLLCLYSGGLDSAAGLLNRVASNPTRPIVPVTVWHQPIQRKVIGRQFDLIAKQFGVQITPLIVKSALIWSQEMRTRFREERTQRSRSFLFAAVGAVATAMAGGSEVELYESGIGALNLPLMSGMVGSRTTRSAHPEFLRQMGRFVELALGNPFSFVLPFADKTKGQVLTNAKRYGLAEIAPTTVSCVHFPLRESAKQCGVCPACIFRRQSLAIADLKEPHGTYKYDLFDDVTEANRVPKKHLDYLKAFLGQVTQLDEIDESRPLPLRIRRHIAGTGLLSDRESELTVGRLLRAYRNEWMETVADAQGRGISWTKLLGRGAFCTEGAPHAVA